MTSLDVPLNMTVQTLKGKLSEKHGLDPALIRLFLPLLGKTLRDNQRLIDYNLHEGSCIEFKHSRHLNKPLKLRLSNGAREFIYVDFESSMKNLGSVKTKIFEKMGIPVSAQKFMKKG